MTVALINAAQGYLQHIQPRDLADLMTHVQHDMSMLMGSFASYLELFEANLPKVAFPDSVSADFHVSFEGMRYGIQRYHETMTYYAVEPSSMTSEEFLACFLHDVLHPIGLLLGYAALMKYDFEANPLSSLPYQRAQHLLEAMQATAERMKVIGSACYEYSH